MYICLLRNASWSTQIQCKITVFLKIEGFSVRNLSYCLPEMSLANKLLNSFPGIGGQKGNTFSSDSHNSYKRQLLVEGSS